MSDFYDCDGCGVHMDNQWPKHLPESHCVFYHQTEMYFCKNCYSAWLFIHRFIVSQYKDEPYPILDDLAMDFSDSLTKAWLGRVRRDEDLVKRK